MTAQAIETAGPPRGAVATLLLGLSAVGANSLVLSPVLPAVAGALGSTPIETARAISAYGAATALSALLMAPLVDRHGARRALLAPGMVLLAAMLANAAARSWVGLAAAQALAGLAAGVTLPATYAAVTAAAPAGQEARVLGRVLTGWAVSLVAGVPLAAALADLAGWRAVHAALAALVVAALAGFARRPGGAPAAAPAVSRRAALGRPGVARLLGANLAFMTAFYGVYAYLGDHLAARLGASPTAAGLVVLSDGVGFGAASLPDGLLDRLGPGRILPLALGAAAAACAALASASGSLAATLAVAAGWGVASHAGLNLLVLGLARAGGPAGGATLGLNSAATHLGASVGPLALGAVYARAGLPAAAFAAAVLCAGAAALVGRSAPG